MNLDNIYYPCRRVAYRKIDGRMVLVLPIEDKLITLNETASAIFEALDGKTVSEIADIISTTFDIDRDSALVDIDAFLTNMTERGIVETSPQQSEAQ